MYYSLELSEDLIGQHCAEEWAEVAEEGEGVVDDGGAVLAEVQLVLDVDRQNSCMGETERNRDKLFFNIKAIFWRRFNDRYLGNYAPFIP